MTSLIRRDCLAYRWRLNRSKSCINYTLKVSRTGIINYRLMVKCKAEVTVVAKKIVFLGFKSVGMILKLSKFMHKNIQSLLSRNQKRPFTAINPMNFSISGLEVSEHVGC